MIIRREISNLVKTSQKYRASCMKALVHFISFPVLLYSQKIALFGQNVIKFSMQTKSIDSIQRLNITTLCIQCLSCFPLCAIEQVDSNNNTSKLYLVYAWLEYIYGNRVLLRYAYLRVISGVYGGRKFNQATRASFHNISSSSCANHSNTHVIKVNF